MPHVVVIGAGVAGLAAARHLAKKNGFSVTILEATGRVGGRIKTIHMGNESVDLGASWMHSVRQNPLFDEALAQGWPLAYTDSVIEYYTEHGKLARTAGVLPIVEDLHSMIAEDYHQEKPLKEEISLKDYVEASVKSMPLITPEQAHLASLISKQTEHFIGQPWQMIPAGEGGNPDELGRNAFVYGKGYSQVIDWLMETICWENTTLKLNEEVLSIVNSSQSTPFSVHTSIGSVYEANYVICTIPLGSLKTSANHIFKDMTLPAGLIQTIKQTDIAALGKIVLRFKHPFWDPLEQEIVVMHSQTKEVFSVVNPFPAESATLIVLTGPPVTQKIESNPSCAYDTVKWALEAIRTDPTSSVPQPEECVVTNWTQLPHFQCSYSARSIGQGYNEMIQPYIEGVGPLRFAGEHTTFDGNGCVHGAYLSGIREAETIFELDTVL